MDNGSEFLLKIVEIAGGVLAGAAGGFLTGRQAERAASRDRIRVDRGRSLSATETYLLAGLDNLSVPGTLPDRAEYGNKDERMIGDTALFERWLALIVELWPSRGALTSGQLGRLASLRTEIEQSCSEQLARIDSGRAALLADLDVPSVHKLRLGLDDLIAGANAR